MSTASDSSNPRPTPRRRLSVASILKPSSKHSRPQCLPFNDVGPITLKSGELTHSQQNMFTAVPQASGSARPPSRRVDMGDDEPSMHVRSAVDIKPATTATRGRLSRNESFRSYASQSTWDELDMLSCHHSIGTSTTVSGRRPPPPTRGISQSSRRTFGGNDSVRSFASFSTRGELDFLYEATSSMASSAQRQKSPAETPPFLFRTTTQSSVRAGLGERQDSISSSITGMLMTKTVERGSKCHRGPSSRPGNPVRGAMVQSDASVCGSTSSHSDSTHLDPVAIVSSATAPPLPTNVVNPTSWQPGNYSFLPFRRASM
jgi:hypothetical protein